MFQSERDALLFFGYLNIQQPDITFTFEKESNNHYHILITESPNKLLTSVFYKKTYTGLLINFLSFCSINYKAIIKLIAINSMKSHVCFIDQGISKCKMFLFQACSPVLVYGIIQQIRSLK